MHWFQTIGIALLMFVDAQALQVSVNGSSSRACVEGYGTPFTWISSDDTPCSWYVDEGACTPSGTYGTGWRSWYGTYQNWAVNGIDATMACCGCGGGIISTATPAPTVSQSWPTPAPTFPPVGATSQSGIQSGPIAATGDPHLQNVHGERFDVMRPGKHLLINIPRGEGVEKALLRVEADARRLGGQCADMYFQELNITGAWADAKKTGGFRFNAEDKHDGEHPDWIHVGTVELKVAHGRTQQGAQYLNFYVKHLGRAGFAVGGLLGEDDHSEAEMPSEACAQRLSLLAGVTDQSGSVLSVAEASLA